MVAWPLVAQGVTAAASAASAASGFMGEGGEGLNRDDARYLADFQMKQALRNEQFQNDLAKQGIRWKVADAEAAGLHPLAALGVNSGAGSFGTAFDTSGRNAPSRLQRGLSGLGQDVSRAAMAMTTPQEKEFKQLQLQKLRTENEILNTDLLERRKSLMSPGSSAVGTPSVNPNLNGFMGMGQNDAATSSRVTDIPLKRTFSDPQRPWQQAGAISDFAYVKTPNGYAIVPSKDVKESIEDQIIPELSWALRNYGLATLGVLPKPDIKKYKLPPGYTSWRYSIPLQQYVPAKERFRLKMFGRTKAFDY